MMKQNLHLEIGHSDPAGEKESQEQKKEPETNSFLHSGVL